MLPTGYETQNCSIAGTLEIVGERWSILIVREAFLGTRRFDDYQRKLGIARNILQARLERLMQEGIIERKLYHERPPRYAYRLSAKGVDLWPVVVALLKWGDRHAAPNGPPVILEHKGCGGEVDDRRRCTKCGAELEARDAVARRGPGARDVGDGQPAAPVTTLGVAALTDETG